MYSSNCVFGIVASWDAAVRIFCNSSFIGIVAASPYFSASVLIALSVCAIAGFIHLAISCVVAIFARLLLSALLFVS